MKQISIKKAYAICKYQTNACSIQILAQRTESNRCHISLFFEKIGEVG